MTKTKAAKNLTSLQVFRGLAALAVMLYHIDGRYRADTPGEVVQPVFEERFLGGWFGSGHIGVDFFFVWSGVIIFLIHEKDLGAPETGGYYLLKRITRIYPVLLAAIALKYTLALVAGTLWTKADLQLPALLSTLLLLPVNPTFVSGAWTLVHEMLFYFLFLLGVLIGRKVFWAVLLLWVCAILSLDFTGNRAAMQGALSFVFHPHNLQFCIGVLVAYTVNKLPPQNTLLPWVALTAALLLIICGSSFFLEQWEYEILSRKTLFWGVIFGLFITASVIWDRCSCIRWPKFLSVMGDASYSIYLFHLIFVAVFKLGLSKVDFLCSNPQLMMGMNAILTLVCCLFVWRFFEKPTLEWCNRKIQRTTITSVK